MNCELLGELAGRWLVTSGSKIFLILIAVIFVDKFLNTAFNKFLESKKEINAEHNKNLKTMCSMLNSGLKFAVFTVAIMLILEELGLNIGPLIAAAGILGVAVSFGSQKLVEDLISGFIILVNNQLRVGDMVQIEGKRGCVEKITLSMVVLKDDEGQIHFIRNGRIGVITREAK